MCYTLYVTLVAKVNNFLKGTKMTNIENATISFVACFQNSKNVYFAKHYKNLNPPLIKIYPGRKFYKITSISEFGDGQESVTAFVDKSTGDIYKPAGWSSRAKHARGNVLSVGNGREALTPDLQYVRYLK